MSKISDSLLSAMEIIAKKVVASETTEFDRTIQAQIICKEEKGYRVKYQDSTFIAETLNTDNYEYEAAEWVYVLHSNSNNYNMILGLVPQGNPDIVDTGSGEDYVKIGNDCCLNTVEKIVNGEKEFPPFKLCSYTGIEQLYNLYEAEGAADGSITVTQDLIGIDQALAQESISNSTSLLIGAQFQSKLPIEQQEVGNYGLIVTLAYEGGGSIPYVLDVNRMQGNPYAQTSNFIDQSFIFKIDDGANFSYIKRIDFFCAGFKSATEKKPYDLFMKEPRIYGVVAASELDTYSISVQMPNGNTFNSTNVGETRKFVGVYREKGKKVSGVEYYWFKENRLATSTETGYHAYGGKGWQLLNEDPAAELVLKGTDVPVASRLYKCVAYANGIKVEKEFVVKNTAEGLPNLVIKPVEGKEHQLKVTLENGGGYAKDARYEWYYVFNGVSQVISNDANNTVAQLADATKISYTPQTGALTFKCAYFYKNGTVEENLLTATYEVAAEFAIEEYSIVVQQGAQVFQYNEAGQAPHIYQTNFAIAPLTIKFYYKGVEQQLTENEVIWSYPNNNTLIQYAGSASPSADSVLVDRNNIYAHEFAFTLANTYDVSKAANNLVQVTIAAREGANGWPQITKDVPITFLKQGDPGTNGTGYYCNISAVGDRDYIVDKDTNKNTLQLQVQVWNGGEIVDVDANKITWSMLKGGTLTLEGSTVKGNFSSSSPWNVVQVKVTIDDLVLYDTFPVVVTTNETVLLEPNSGYKHVVYEADGTNPSYASRPFVLRNGATGTWAIPPIPATYNGNLDSPITVTCTATKGTLYVPIHMSLNRYAHAWLNDWDGNTLEVNEEGGYILAPQIGAGVKNDETNVFTGITIGTYVQGNEQKIGLFGFSSGEQSIFLNADDGSAHFGKDQIVIDPKNGAATITGGTYSYDSSNGNPFSSSGTQINLTTGDIITPGFSVIDGNASFNGSGTFTGDIYANNGTFKGAIQSGSTITGATITGGSLKIGGAAATPNFKVDENGNVTLNGNITWGSGASPTQVAYNRTNATPPENGTKWDNLNADYTSNSNRGWHRTFNTTYDKYASYTYDGGTTWGAAIQVTAKDGAPGARGPQGEKGIASYDDIWGYLKTEGDGIYQQEVNGVKKIGINANYINAGVINASLITTGTFAINDENNNPIFTANANNKAVKIGGFTVTASSLYTNNKTAFDQQIRGVHIGSEGIGLGTHFKVSSAGAITCDSGEIGGWSISSSGLSHSSTTSYNTTRAVTLSPTGGLLITDTGLSEAIFEITSSGSINANTINSYFLGNLSGKSVVTENYFRAGSSSGWQITLDGQSSDEVSIIIGSNRNTRIWISEYSNTGGLYGNWESDSFVKNSSDINKKNTINILSNSYTNIFDQLRPVTFKYNNGTSDRLHTGFIAQEVEQAVLDAGLTTQEFAAICYDIDEEGNKVDYGIRYEELIALCVDSIQKLKARVNALEAQLQS